MMTKDEMVPDHDDTATGPAAAEQTQDGTAADEPSTTRPLVKWSEAWWATRSPDVQARRCTARLSDESGQRCGKAAMKGQRVCGTHGGRSKRAIEAAKRRIAETADVAAKQLLKLAFDDKQSADIRLKATLQLLDRAGVNAKTSVEVEVGVKPVNQIMEGIVTTLETGSRADWRRSQGIVDDNPPALADLGALCAGDSNEVIGEVVDEGEYRGRIAAQSRVNEGSQADAHDVYERDRAERAAASLRRSQEPTSGHVPRRYDSPDDGMMTTAEAADHVGNLRRAAAQRVREDALDAGHAVVHRPQRALPPGRSSR